MLPFHALSGLYRAHVNVIVFNAVLEKYVDKSQYKHVFSSLSSMITSLEQPAPKCKSSFYILTLKGYAQVPIANSDNIKSGIYRYLSTFLLKFNPHFEGVWISFKQIKKLDTLADMNYNAELLSIPISLKALVFMPKPGTKAYGRVSKRNKNKVTLGCFGVFNTIIETEQPEEDIDKGDLVTFKIKRVAKQNDWITLHATSLKRCKIVETINA